MDDKRLAAAQAMASRMGRDWAGLSDDARSVFMDLAGAAMSVDAPPKRAAEPEQRIRALRGRVEIWTPKLSTHGFFN